MARLLPVVPDLESICNAMRRCEGKAPGRLPADSPGPEEAEEASEARSCSGAQALARWSEPSSNASTLPSSKAFTSPATSLGQNWPVCHRVRRSAERSTANLTEGTAAARKTSHGREDEKEHPHASLESAVALRALTEREVHGHVAATVVPRRRALHVLGAQANSRGAGKRTSAPLYVQNSEHFAVSRGPCAATWRQEKDLKSRPFAWFAAWISLLG